MASCLFPRTNSSFVGDDDKEDLRDNLASGAAPSGLSSVGPSGEFASAPRQAFTPASFTPGTELGPEAEDDEDIVTGHDRVKPGRLPWTVFRAATVLLVVLWAVAAAGPLGLCPDLVMQPAKGEEEAVVVQEPHRRKRSRPRQPASRPAPALESVPESALKADIPTLPDGELVQTAWPSHSGFSPRALSSDPFGKQLVVSDDFGIYSALLRTGLSQIATPSRTTGVSLIGGASSAQMGLFASFQHLPPCSALEGQALKDISVACSGEELSDSKCEVFVLHDHGLSLSECPMPAASAPAAHTKSPPVANRSTTWSIPRDWLHDGAVGKGTEQVESVAVDSDCFGASSGAAASRSHGGNGKRKFRPDQSGCVVVGTTSGRVVQLRRHMTEGKRLVPEKAVQVKPHSVSQGELHVFPDGFIVALRKETNSIEAIDARIGTPIGQWKLPSDIAWGRLTGGGGNLFVLGQKIINGTQGADVSLYRFPLPQKLKEWRSSEDMFESGVEM